MKRRTSAMGICQTKFLKAGATSTAFLFPVILAAAFLNLGQSSCGGGGPPPPPPDFTVSKSTAGEAGNGTSKRASVSGDGYRVVFQSTSTNLGPSTPTQGDQVFLRDLATNETTLVSYWQDGLSSGGRITADGLHVAYWDAEFDDETSRILGPWRLIVRDLETNTDEIIDDARTWHGGYSTEIAASVGAQLIAFSTELGLEPTDTNDTYDIYVKDRMANTLTRVSVPATGGQYESATGPELSPDGQWIAFEAREEGESVVVLKQLVPPGEEFKFPSAPYGLMRDSMDSLAEKIVYTQVDGLLMMFDRIAGTHQTVSIDAFGNPENCWAGVLSGNGRYVAFFCEQPMTSHGASGQVYVRDLVEGWTKLASIDHTGLPGSYESFPQAMPYDGSAVVIVTVAFNLHSGGASDQIVKIPSGYWDEGESLFRVVQQSARAIASSHLGTRDYHEHFTVSSCDIVEGYEYTKWDKLYGQPRNVLVDESSPDCTPRRDVVHISESEILSSLGHAHNHSVATVTARFSSSEVAASGTSEGVSEHGQNGVVGMIGGKGSFLSQTDFITERPVIAEVSWDVCGPEPPGNAPGEFDDLAGRALLRQRFQGDAYFTQLAGYDGPVPPEGDDYQNSGCRGDQTLTIDGGAELRVTFGGSSERVIPREIGELDVSTLSLGHSISVRFRPASP